MRPPTLNRLQMNGGNLHEQSSEQNESDDDAPSQRTRAPRHSKAAYNSTAAKPANLSFYNDLPGWKAVLDSAKQKFCLHIAIVMAFPSIETDISIATGNITEAIADFRADNKQVPLDMSMFRYYRSSKPKA